MPLTSGEAVGYDANRMCYEFTMMNQDAVVPCSISSVALDELARRSASRDSDRDAQFLAFREQIEDLASTVFEKCGLDRGAVRIFAKHFRYGI